MGISIYVIGLLFSAIKGAPYVPTSKKQLDIILTNSHLKKGAQLVELGSGDGRMLRYAAKKFGIQGVGIEINPLLVWWSSFLARRDGTNKMVKFVRKNIFDYPLSHADYVYIFLMPELISKLLPKMKRELKKGTTVISHGFKIVGFEKLLIHTVFDTKFSTFYYKI